MCEGIISLDYLLKFMSPPTHHTAGEPPLVHVLLELLHVTGGQVGAGSLVHALPLLDNLVRHHIIL